MMDYAQLALLFVLCSAVCATKMHAEIAVILRLVNVR